MKKQEFWAKVQTAERYICALLFPNSAMCPICLEARNVIVEYGICPDCLEELKDIRVPAAACHKCLSPVKRGSACSMCKTGGMKDVDASFSPFCYKKGMRKLVHEFKFECNGNFLPLFGDEMARALSDTDFDILCPVPLTEERLYSRGRNQAELLAEALSLRTGIPVVNALKRTGKKKPQSETPLHLRAENVKGCFSVSENVMGRKVLIIDDVRTTGSTAQACAAVLKKAGALKVGLCTLAVVYRHKTKYTKKRTPKRKRFQLLRK